MKGVLFILALVPFAVTSCSTCYECTEPRIEYDANLNPIDTTYVSDEFCTADQQEVTDREEEGADCKVQ